MNAFSPFAAEWQPDNTLQLKLSPTRKKLHFAVTVAMPLILLGSFLVVTVILPEVGLPKWFYIMYSVILLVTLFASLRMKLVAEVHLTKKTINQRYYRMFQTNDADFIINEVDHIQVVTNYGRSAGYYYYLRMKNGSGKVLLLNIPKWFLKTEQKQQINEALQQATGLEVKPA